MFRQVTTSSFSRQIVIAGRRRMIAMKNHNNKNTTAGILLQQQPLLLTHHQQVRQYVFFPSSFSEVIRSIKDVLNKNKIKRRKILVKLQKDHDEHKKKRTKRLKNWMDKKRRKHVIRRKHWNDRMNRFITKSEAIHKYYKLKHDKRRKQWRDRFNKSSLRMKDLHRQYKLKYITLTERSSKSWFDSDGLPLTSKDKLTGRFVNPWASHSTDGTKSLIDLTRWRIQRMFNVLKENGLLFFIPRISLFHHHKQQEQLSLSSAKSSDPPLKVFENNNRDTNNIRLTWIGHSTLIVQMADYTMITDPMFSLRASPMQSLPLGVARFVQPSIPVSALENNDNSIDICLISHDHYDHLDVSSCIALKNSVKLWIVPLGIKEFLSTYCKIPPNKIVELKWWDKIKIMKKGDMNQFDFNDVEDKNDKNMMKTIVIDNDNRQSSTNNNSQTSSKMEVTCTPAQHWGSRSSWDRNKRLWCSWSVETYNNNNNANSDNIKNNKKLNQLKFYFAGDTGYPESFPLYKQIGDRLGPYDLSAIPIGAYEPSYFMKESHINPYEAVQLHKDIRSKKSVGIHWGTFALTEEKHDEPPLLLQKAIEEEKDGTGGNIEKATDYYDREYKDNDTGAIDDDVDKKKTIDFVVLKHGEYVESNS